MSKKNDRAFNAATICNDPNRLPYGLEVIFLLAAMEVATGAPFTKESMRPVRETPRKPRGSAAFMALGFGGKHGISFDRDGEGRPVTGSLLLNAVECREEFNEYQKMVIRAFAYRLQGQTDVDVVSNEFFGAIWYAYQEVDKYTGMKFLLRNMRGVIRALFNGRSNDLQDETIAAEVYKVYVNYGEGTGAMVSYYTNFGVIRRLLDVDGAYGLQFVVELEEALDGEEPKVRRIYGKIGDDIEGAIYGAVVDLQRAAGEFPIWEDGLVDSRLGARVWEVKDGEKSSIVASQAFAYIAQQSARQVTTLADVAPLQAQA